MQSEQGPEVTIIDGHNTFGPIVTFQSGETQASRLSGFSLQNGRAFFGAGIFIQSASPTVDGSSDQRQLALVARFTCWEQETLPPNQ